MRYTETISIPWHTFAGEKPCPNRDIVVKHYGATTLFAPSLSCPIHSENLTSVPNISSVSELTPNT